MENIVKQIQLVALVIILVSTVIAFGQEMYQMILVQRVTLADLLLLFLYLEVLAMVRVCLLYTSPSPRDTVTSRMPSSA